MRITPLALAALMAAATPARAEPANSLRELFAQMNACLGALALPGGSDVTVQFMLNRRGGLIGKPRLTHAQWPDAEAARRAAETISAAFDRCLPASITDALGGAIAGRLIAYRLRPQAADEKKA